MAELLENSHTYTNAPTSASVILFIDPATKYRQKMRNKTIEDIQSSWIGPKNCTVNTLETDTMEEVRSEWIKVHEAPFDPKVDKFTSGRLLFAWTLVRHFFVSCSHWNHWNGVFCNSCVLFLWH